MAAIINIVIFINSCSVALGLVLLLRRYYKLLRWQITKGYISKFDTLITTGMYESLVLEMFLMIICPYAFLRGITIEH